MLRRTFLLEELAAAARAGAELEGATAADRLADIPEAIQAFRPELASLDIPDAPDPYRRPQEVYDESFHMIDTAVQDIVTWVRGLPKPHFPPSPLSFRLCAPAQRG